MFNIDLSACKCDLTYNFCDNFCCCDKECPSVKLKIIAIIYRTNKKGTYI